MAIFDLICGSVYRRWRGFIVLRTCRTKVGGFFVPRARINEDGGVLRRWVGFFENGKNRRTPYLRRTLPPSSKNPPFSKNFIFSIFRLRKTNTPKNEKPLSTIFNLRPSIPKVVESSIFDFTPRRISRRSNGNRGRAVVQLFEIRKKTISKKYTILVFRRRRTLNHLLPSRSVVCRGSL